MCKPLKITPPQAAALMGKSQLFVYEGLRREYFPFGYAIQTGEKRWTYYISPPQFAAFLGISLEDLTEEVSKL